MSTDQPTQPDNSRRNLIGLTAVVLFIIAAFILLVDWNEVLRILENVHYGLLALSSMALVIGMFFFALRWRVLMENKPQIGLTFHASNIGFAGNILIPFRGGEALRIFVMGRSGQVSYTTAAASFVVERSFEQLMRVLALVTAFIIGAGIQITPITILSGFGFIALLSVVIYWLINHRQIIEQKTPATLARIPHVSESSAHQWLSDLFDNLQHIAKPHQIALVMGYSLLTWGFFWLFFFLTLVSMGTPFPPEAWLPISLGALALSPPSAPTQPGIFHASIVVPLAAVGFDTGALTAYAVILHLLEMFWMIGLAGVGLLRIGLSPRQLVSTVNE
jgi:uncharacterized protein (TIRG00374 family)